MEEVVVRIDAGNIVKPFNHFYDAIGYANADFTYTPPTLRMYDYLSSFHNHFRYMRLHNILTSHGKGDYYLLYRNESYGGQEKESGDDSHTVSADSNGELSYDWTVTDKVYDIMLEHGMRPIVETLFIPICIRKDIKIRYIPKDYKLWRQIVRAFTMHLEERYGADEIEKWYFEVWNEPDNQKEWIDDASSFMALYDYMEDAIHSVNPRLKVGGPAVSQGTVGMKIYREFLEHCKKGLNYANGTFGARLDFVSVHCKGGWPGSYCPSTEFMFGSLKDFMQVLKGYPEFENIEFLNDESDIVWEGNQGIEKESWLNFRNTHYFPGFVCKMVDTYCRIAEDEYGVNFSIMDSDNCHLQWEKFLFSGNRSQFTPLVKYPSTDLIRKPAFNGYILLSRLGDQRLAAECEGEGYGRKYGVLPTVKEDILSIMVWNFEDGMDGDINTRKIILDMKNISFTGKYIMIHYRIDSRHSSSYNVWNELGRPPAPTVEQVMRIREKEGLELMNPVCNINMQEDMRLELEMPMHSVSLLLVVPENIQKPDAPRIIKALYEEGFNKNPQVFLKWIPNKEKDFLYYRIWRRVENESVFELLSDNFSVNAAVYTDMNVKRGRKYYYSIQAVNASMIYSELSQEALVEIEDLSEQQV